MLIFHIVYIYNDSNFHPYGMSCHLMVIEVEIARRREQKSFFLVLNFL